MHCPHAHQIDQGVDFVFKRWFLYSRDSSGVHATRERKKNTSDVGSQSLKCRGGGGGQGVIVSFFLGTETDRSLYRDWRRAGKKRREESGRNKEGKEGVQRRKG